MKSLQDLLKAYKEDESSPVPFRSAEDAAAAEAAVHPAELDGQMSAPSPKAPSVADLINPAPAPAAPMMSEMRNADLMSVTDSGRSPAVLPTPASSVSPAVAPSAQNAAEAPAAPETGEARLERLMRELKGNREKEMADAANRQMKAEMMNAIAQNLGLVIGGAQAMNTKAAVTPAQTKGIDVGDLQAIVERKYKPDQEALMEQYKTLMSAKNKGNQAITPYQMAMLGLTSRKLDQQAEMFDRANKGRDDSREALNEERFERHVQKAGDALGNGQDLLGALDNFERKLGKDEDSPLRVDDLTVDPKSRKLLGKEGKEVDLPGASIPGIGRTSFYSGKARDMAAALEKIFNVELKNRSGQAVTSTELIRLRREFNQGKFNTEAEMVQAVKDYKRMTADALRNEEARFKPEVIEEYKSRGGATSDRFLTAEQKQKSAVDTIPAPAGETVTRGNKTYKWNPATGKYQPL